MNEVDATNADSLGTSPGDPGRFRRFVEQMCDGAAIVDSDGCILYANDSFGVLSGSRVGILSSVVAEEDQVVLRTLMTQAEHGMGKGEVHFVSDQGPVPVYLSIFPLGDGSGCFGVNVTDLIEQKRNDVLMASERLTRSILDNSTEAIVVCDRQGRVIRANAAAARLSRNGTSLGTFEQTFDLDLGPEAAGTGLPVSLAGALDGQVVKGLETKLSTASGDVDLLISVGPLRSGQTLEGCVVTMTDITERNSAFRDLRDLNESLEKRVDERTEQLSEANKELEGFCYSVSHDLRAPLRSMMGASMILTEDFMSSLPPEAAEEVQRISRSAKKMGDLIDDLLRFSRLGRQSMEPQEIDLSELAQATIRDFRSAEVEHVRFEVQPGMTGFGDAALIKVAFDNLIGNSVKFTRGRQDTLIRVGETEIEGKRVFFVEDNGVGFDEQYADKIFLPFERLHAEKTYPGSGIGLANVHRIISRHGGRIWGKSRENQGATFYFTLGSSAEEMG